MSELTQTPPGQAPLSQTPLGLYIHWPFCRSKCPYCDFNSHVSQSVDIAAWQTSLIAEMRWIADLYQSEAARTSSSGKPLLSSVFFGGGTPSLMPPALIAALCAEANQLFQFTDDIEITAEANPTSVETDKLASFRAAGVNRLSLGIQALRAEDLQFLGREHSPDEALRALEAARHLFTRVSADMIYGLPDQTPEAWLAQLHQLQALGLDHLSAYQLTIEPGTVFYSRARTGETMRVSPDRMADFYSATENAMAEAGLYGYEISNYARPGAECRHNLIYWRAQDWLAIGPGGHARFTLKDGGRWQGATRRSPSGWLDQIAQAGHGYDKISRENRLDHGEEILMMGLRLAEGIDYQSLTETTGLTLDEVWINRFCEEGWLQKQQGRLIATNEGRQRLDYILGNLIA